MYALIIAAALAQSAAPPPPDDGGARVAASKTPCKCGCGSDVCRCSDSKGGCKMKAGATVPLKSSQVVLQRQPVYRTETRRFCQGGRCFFQQVQVLDHWEDVPMTVEATATPLATAEAAHTPLEEVTRVLALLPKPQVGFVDLGCGYDARWCVAAAEKWGCKVTGVEIDPDRATAARERVRNLGLDHLITIVEGDAETADAQGDVAAVYLFPDLLKRLRPRLAKFRAVASYMHNVDGLPMRKSGDTFIYQQQAVTLPMTQAQAAPQRYAVWGGQVYTSDYNPRCNCVMCRSIRHDLGIER